jgi:hypothetical protein
MKNLFDINIYLEENDTPLASYKLPIVRQVAFDINYAIINDYIYQTYIDQIRSEDYVSISNCRR